MMPCIKSDINAELAQIQAESIVCILLDEGAYLCLTSNVFAIEVVGLPKPEMQGSSVLWHDRWVSK